MAPTSTTSAESVADRELVQTRTFDAPRELVFKAWTEAEHVARWWGPNGFTHTTHHMDVRPGGEWRYTMHGPDGTDYPNHTFYIEVKRPERLIYSHGGTKEDGPAVRFETTVTFEDIGGKTRVTMRGVFPSVAAKNEAIRVYKADEGGKQHMAKLGEYLSSLAPSDKGDPGRDFVISRTFDAPRDLVFKSWTDPERLKRWWGPKGFKVHTSAMDLRPGGYFHYGMTSPDGQPMWGKFVFREITPPERLVFVNSFSDEKRGVTRHPWHMSWPLELLSTVTFTEQGGKTTVTVRWAPLNATETERKTFDEGRGSMTQGWTGTFDQFAEYLPKA